MVATKSLTGSRGSGIRSIPSAIEAEAKTGELLAILQKAGLPINQLDDYIRSEADVLKFINIIKNANKPRVIPGSSAEGKAITEKLFGKKGNVIEGNFGKSFKEEIDSMKKSGDLVDKDNMVISEKITDREMFKNSNLNKEPISEKFIDYTIQDINKKEPLEGMKIANKIIKREDEFKDLTEEQSKRILKETDDHLTGKDIDYDPEDFYAQGGRAGFYTGGITDVEPRLDDIGHGSDSLMARTRLLSPNNQATTSTGLNYLLAEDNDNIRVPFSGGNTVRDKIIEMKKHFKDLKKNYPKSQISYKDFKLKYIPENFAEGGRIGFANGNGVADEDAEKAILGKRVRELMDDGFEFGEAVKKAMSEGYAEGGRIGFAGGGGGRRAFLKLLATLGGGAAAFKTGILGLGKGGTKKAVTETVKQAAGSGGQVPPYFLNLVKKIKNLGDDVTEKSATLDRQKVTKYKEYELTEDVTTGKQEIQRYKVLDDDSADYYGQPLTEETYMSYKPGETIIGKGGKSVKTQPEYEEGTALLRSDRGNAGEIVDESFTISDDVIKEGTVFEDTLSEFGKADGGRIGFSGGGIQTMLGE